MSCIGGMTQIERVLDHAINETERAKVAAVVFVGDAMEEKIDPLCHRAGQLGASACRSLSSKRATSRHGSRLQTDRQPVKGPVPRLRPRQHRSPEGIARRHRGLRHRQPRRARSLRPEKRRRGAAPDRAVEALKGAANPPHSAQCRKITRHVDLQQSGRQTGFAPRSGTAAHAQTTTGRSGMMLIVGIDPGLPVNWTPDLGPLVKV